MEHKRKPYSMEKPAFWSWLRSLPLLDKIEKYTDLHKATGALALLVTVVCLDILSKHKNGISHLYSIPIWWAAWYLNRRAVAITAGVACFQEISSFLTYEPWSFGAWSSHVMVCAMFIFSGLLVSQLRDYYDDEHRSARVDALTQCLNSRGFYEAADERLDEARRDFKSFTLVCLDLDKFKELNDKVGHLEADHALMLVGQTLRRLTRPTDLVARLGGDEFAVLMSGIQPEMAFAAAERLRESIEMALREKGYGLTMSLGCVVFHDLPQSLKRGLQSADELLYAAKREGRARTVTAVWEGRARRTGDYAVVGASEANNSTDVPSGSMTIA